MGVIFTSIALFYNMYSPITFLISKTSGVDLVHDLVKNKLILDSANSLFYFREK